MSQPAGTLGASRPAPVRRVFAPAPLRTQTHLVGRRDGPPACVVLHRDRGYYVGLSDGRPLWSHEPETLQRMNAFHPDAARTVSTWRDEAAARRSMMEILSYAEWLRTEFATTRCDVATAPPAEAPSADPMPVWGCSVEACHRETGLFAPLAQHRLQDGMLRR